MKEMNIPVGVSDFEEIRKNEYYYIDKSELIGELLSRTGIKVTLITRPRRFGKTLGMSMLESFFDIRKESRKLFEGLKITENQALCDAWMNQYPTIFVSFRQVDGLDFTGAYDMLTMVIADLYNRHLYLLDGKNATDFQKAAFAHLAHGSGSIKEVKSSLMLLTTMMQSYYEKPVILLIDEYDVPVAKANNNGYYDEMLDVMKGLMQALKDNQALRFAVVTGCLKIAKESIFTGTNKFVSDTITNSRLNEYFGFVQSEVDQLLNDAGLTEQADNIRKWYDGYHFGDFDVYSHAQALAQSSDFLSAHKDWKQIAVLNTAVAAKKVMEEKDPSQAAVASRTAGELYGMKILAEEINNVKGNTTRFLILGKEPVYAKTAGKISVAFEIPHKSGSLYNILGNFIFNNVNMTMIESRPIPEKSFEYRFFVDFEGNLSDAGVRNALTGLAAEASVMRILGNY